MENKDSIKKQRNKLSSFPAPIGGGFKEKQQMATATTNILINSISGRIGNIVFYNRRSTASGTITQCARMHVIPSNPDTEAQRVVRRSFGDAVRAWQAMSSEDKYAFNRKARFLNMSGYNLYISNYMKRITQSLNLTSRDEQKSKVSSLTWNLELSTLNLIPLPERIPSVSDSYIKASGINAKIRQLKFRPG